MKWKVPHNKIRILKPGEKLIYTPEEIREIMNDPVKLRKYANFKYRVIMRPKYVPHGGTVMASWRYAADELDYGLRARIETGKASYNLVPMWRSLVHSYNNYKSLFDLASKWLMAKTFHHDPSSWLFRSLVGDDMYSQFKTMYVWNIVKDVYTKSQQENLQLVEGYNFYVYDRVLDLLGISCLQLLKTIIPVSEHVIIDKALDRIYVKRLLGIKLRMHKDEPFLDVKIDPDRFTLFADCMISAKEQFFIAPRKRRPKFPWWFQFGETITNEYYEN